MREKDLTDLMRELSQKINDESPQYKAGVQKRKNYFRKLELAERVEELSRKDKDGR